MGKALMITFAVAALLGWPSPAPATAQHKKHGSLYAEEQHREIKSLSESDLAQLKSGAGWGLAKAAELNGVPGPTHVLEMTKELRLSKKQVVDITAIFQLMKAEAIAVGHRYIVQEQMLEMKFQTNIPAAGELRQMLNEIAATHAHLRYVHLHAHLATLGVLTPEQVNEYNKLRGYDANRH